MLKATGVGRRRAMLLAGAAVAVMTIGGSSRALASPIASESFDYTNG